MVNADRLTSLEGYMDQYKTNVFGVINVTHAFLRQMRQMRSGSVVIIGSRSAWTAKAAVSVYCLICRRTKDSLLPYDIISLLVSRETFAGNEIVTHLYAY